MPAIENPILLDLPDVFETERLILRPPRLTEGDLVYAAIEASRDELRPFMAFADQDREKTEVWLRGAAAAWITRERLPLLIWRKVDGAFIGSTGFHHINWRVPRLEIGYWLSTPMSGAGYMTEAVNGQVHYARQYMGALRIEIWCDVRNIRSAAVARRAGFEHFITSINDERGADGQLQDHQGFCKTWPETVAQPL